VARTVCRRAERAISSLLEDQPRLGDVVLPYMNRLSDLLFVLARAANQEAGVEDPEWRPRS
jgi:cob(I)alamin adenosyltransferase